MNVKTLKNIAAVACVAALAVPAGVSAKGPGEDHSKAGEKQKTAKQIKRCTKKQPQVGFSIKGTLADGSSADAITVNVTKANKHAKELVLKGATTYAVPAGSKVTYEGANPFTTQPAPAFSTYTVKVNGKVIKYKKGCNESNSGTQKPVKPAKVKVHAPEAPATEQEQQTTPNTTP